MKNPQGIQFIVFNPTLTVQIFSLFIVFFLGIVSLGQSYNSINVPHDIEVQLPVKDPIKKLFPKTSPWEIEEQEETQKENQLPFSGNSLIETPLIYDAFQVSSANFRTIKSAITTKKPPLYLLFHNIKIPFH